MKQCYNTLSGALKLLLRRAPGVFAVVAIFALPACSSGGEDDETFAAITSSSFVFSETSPGLNEVGVLSNTSWTVCWAPQSAAVIVKPASGSGNGTFRIVDIPKGATVQFNVTTAAGGTSGRPISVRREGDGPSAYSLALSPSESLRYDPAAPAANVVTVTCNTSWVATPSDAALTISPAQGNGNGTIAVTGIPAGQTHTLTVKAGEGEGAVTKSIAVTRDPEGGEPTVLYYDNFDKADISSGWADAGGWENASGTGAAGVSYAAKQVRVYNNSYGGGGRYTGASTTFGAGQMKSVHEIEQLTGQTFFPEVDQSVKAAYNASDWGF